MVTVATVPQDQVYVRAYCWNYTGSSWTQIYYESCVGSCDETHTGDRTIPSECYTGESTLRTFINASVNRKGVGGHGATYYFYEGEIGVIGGVPYTTSNFYMDVFNLNTITLISGTDFWFEPNSSYFNYTTLTLTQYNISAENQTIKGGLFNISFNPKDNHRLFMNITYITGNDDVYPIYCGNGSSRNNAVLINDTILFEAEEVETQIYCWADYIGASEGFTFNYTINYTII
jgi:hypothetical protein